MLKINYRAAILTSSDKCSVGKREDLSGKEIKRILEIFNYKIVDYIIIEDDKEKLSKQLSYWSDNNIADIIFTTGGTGFSDRDVMPEATTAVADKIVPGISEAIRSNSMKITEKAMLSRAISVIRKKTLIINLPGSPKAVKESLEYVLPNLEHGLDILKGNSSECAETAKKTNKKLNFDNRIRIITDKPFFGPGVARLLNLIKTTDSVKSATNKLGMSYSKSWKIIDLTEKELGCKILDRQKGGKNGGCTMLTLEGEDFLNRYNEFEEKAEQEIEKLFKEYFGDL